MEMRLDHVGIAGRRDRTRRLATGMEQVTGGPIRDHSVNGDRAELSTKLKRPD